MKTCPNCGAQLDDNAMFCTQCGMAQGADGANQQNYYQQNYYQQNQYQYQYQKPVSPYDHTAEYDPDDISKNKVYCMIIYLCPIVGIIIAFLATINEKSPFVTFHIRQGMKLFVIKAILSLAAVLLSWTVVLGIAAGVCIVICMVLQIICFVWVCMGKAKEVPIIRAFNFLN